MHVLVVANNKGGVGKTTLSENICIAAVKKGLKVLGIDMDPQCNFSRRFVAMEIDPLNPEIISPPIEPVANERGSSADIFFNGATISYPIEEYPNLEIIPGHSVDLMRVERVTQEDVAAKVHEHLFNWMTDANLHNEFDLVVIDTGPSKGPLTISAITCATHMLIPAEMEEKSIEGLHGMLAFWRMNNLKRPETKPLKLVGILANKYDERLPLHRHFYKSLSSNEHFMSYVLPQKMHNWQDYKESDMADGTRVLELPKSNRTRQETEQITDEILGRIANG